MASKLATVEDLSATNAGLRRENEALRSQLVQLRDDTERASAITDRVVRLDLRMRATVLHLEPRGRLALGPTQERATERTVVECSIPDRPAPSAAKLTSQASRLEGHLQELRGYFEDQSLLLGAIPSVWPVEGRVSSEFGSRMDPIGEEPGSHPGLDIAAHLGELVIAPASATVLFSGTEGGYGNVVVLDHGYGIKTRFGHLSELTVTPGRRVKRGDVIGRVGSTGYSTGPHLHYEVRVRGVATDPRPFILDEQTLTPAR
ncbi:MAG: M23 family metallopeptidase [Myxococcaceae bacterium]